MDIWFTSDTHLGHANIIKYCKRPFKSLESMNNRIISNWNSRVKDGDMVFHLGDFCFRNSNDLRGEGVRLNADHWLSKLNGRIMVLKGNHDKNNSMNSPIERMILSYGGKKILLLHNPIDIEKIDRIKFDLILCGHVHEKWKKQGKIINVGVDVWNFMPISLDEIIKEINS
jgi:calcineurin-like phosphoesterase family protein